MKKGDRVRYKDGRTEGTVVHRTNESHLFVLFDRFVLGDDGKYWKLMEVKTEDVERIGQRSNC